MAAERDNQQGITFIYSNLYQVYRQGKLDAQVKQENAQVTGESTHLKGVVLKHSETENHVQQINPDQLGGLKKWLRSNSESSKSLSNDMKALKDARKRLVFLLNDLETLLKT